MVIFEDMFMESKGKAVEYKGKIIQMWDKFPIPKGKSKVRFRFVSTDSEWKQGIALRTKGSILIDEDAVKGLLRIWEHPEHMEGVLECLSKDGILEVYNVWDTGHGSTDAWHNGAAIIVEEIQGGRRYHCNDGHPDDDFDDLIFELVLE